jgi:hypothetical protein
MVQQIAFDQFYISKLLHLAVGDNGAISNKKLAFLNYGHVKTPDGSMRVLFIVLLTGCFMLHGT